MGKQITEFIQGRFPSLTIAPDDDVFALGFVNSLFAMELVMFLEHVCERVGRSEILAVEQVAFHVRVRWSRRATEHVDARSVHDGC